MQTDVPTGPRILFLDIETFPNLAYVWGKYDQNVIKFTQESCIATYAAKWLRQPVFAKALPDYKGYRAGSYDDLKIVKDLWKLFDDADIIVAHNGDDFDVRVCRARFILHDLKPPSTFKTVDTKKVAKRIARFNSNRLDDIGEHLGMGRKIKTDFDLWEGCIRGDKTSWKNMVDYNKQDVVLLEKTYLRLLPWIVDHPNRGIYDPSAMCPKCGSVNVQFRGFAICSTRRYRRFQCQDCGGWGRETNRFESVKLTNAV